MVFSPACLWLGGFTTFIVVGERSFILLKTKTKEQEEEDLVNVHCASSTLSQETIGISTMRSPINDLRSTFVMN